MENTLTKVSNLAAEFAEASKTKDLEYLANLLHDKGTFNIKNAKLKTKEVNKVKFIKWYKTQLENTEITDVVYDQCIHCKLGCRVVLFNEGQFPVKKTKDSSARIMTGIAVEEKDGKIFDLVFCNLFVTIENKCEFELETDRIFELQEKGYTYKEACKMVTGMDLDSMPPFNNENNK